MVERLVALSFFAGCVLVTADPNRDQAADQFADVGPRAAKLRKDSVQWFKETR
jgi:hypothetical protein